MDFGKASLPALDSSDAQARIPRRSPSCSGPNRFWKHSISRRDPRLFLESRLIHFAPPAVTSDSETNRMKKMLCLFALSVTMLLGVAPPARASTIVLDFQDLSIPGDTFLTFFTPYESQGFSADGHLLGRLLVGVCGPWRKLGGVFRRRHRVGHLLAVGWIPGQCPRVDAD